MMNNTIRSYQEKRNYIRMKIEVPVKITLNADGTNIEGICKDLSGGGCLVELDTILPVGTEAEVIISSGHGHNPMLKALAKVTRVVAQPDETEQTCTLGMEILQVLN